jgi:hypothetical protein
MQEARGTMLRREDADFDRRGPPGDRRGKQGQLAPFDSSNQQVVPIAQQSSQQLMFNHKMTSAEYRKLFDKNAVPINVVFKSNHTVIKVQKVDQFQNLLSNGNEEQSIVSPTFKAARTGAASGSARDKNCLPSRAKPPRRDKAVVVSQALGKARKPAVGRSPIQPGSFMASARGFSRAGGSPNDNGPKKRSRTDTAEEGDHGKEGQQAGAVYNNPDFEDKTAGPGSQAR